MTDLEREKFQETSRALRDAIVSLSDIVNAAGTERAMEVARQLCSEAIAIRDRLSFAIFELDLKNS